MQKLVLSLCACFLMMACSSGGGGGSMSAEDSNANVTSMLSSVEHDGAAPAAMPLAMDIEPRPMAVTTYYLDNVLFLTTESGGNKRQYSSFITDSAGKISALNSWNVENNPSNPGQCGDATDDICGLARNGDSATFTYYDPVRDSGGDFTVESHGTEVGLDYADFGAHHAEARESGGVVDDFREFFTGGYKVKELPSGTGTFTGKAYGQIGGMDNDGLNGWYVDGDVSLTGGTATITLTRNGQNCTLTVTNSSTAFSSCNIDKIKDYDGINTDPDRTLNSIIKYYGNDGTNATEATGLIHYSGKGPTVNEGEYLEFRLVFGAKK
ncbi:MAG: hypothetical protein LBV04_05350 [Deferribacteraceae bacterium]|jgi:hypothetical protein|nr:hypothetical protein [Deferribacteraceae bacterium]